VDPDEATVTRWDVSFEFAGFVTLWGEAWGFPGDLRGEPGNHTCITVAGEVTATRLADALRLVPALRSVEVAPAHFDPTYRFPVTVCLSMSMGEIERWAVGGQTPDDVDGVSSKLRELVFGS
jgi:hypothetical protein